MKTANFLNNLLNETEMSALRGGTDGCVRDPIVAVLLPPKPTEEQK